MQGPFNSVLTRFQEAAPGLFIVKCYCHSFSLVAEHATEFCQSRQNSLCKTFTTISRCHQIDRSLSLSFRSLQQQNPTKF